MENPEKEKRKVHRSPGYPMISLGDAIEKAGIVYREEKRSATTADVIAHHLGYSQASGPGGRTVSALRQYGLLEEHAGRYRISDIAYTLLHHDKNTYEWQAAIAEAAYRPSIFKELVSEDGNIPSDATLKTELLRRGYNPAVIPHVISVFRDTVALADSPKPIHNGGREEPKMTPAPTPAPQSVPPSSFGEQLAAKLNADVRQDVFSLAEGQATITWPANLSAESIADLKDWLDLVVRKIGRSKEPDWRDRAKEYLDEHKND